MKKLHRLLLAITAGLCLTTQVHAQSTTFPYSGQLDDNNNPANGSYVFRFTLFDAANGGTVVAGPVQPPVTGVTNGAFTLALDFGNVFDGSDRWLEIEVHTNSNGAPFTTLNPRTQILPTPYAITANRLSGTVATANLADAAVTAEKLSATGPASGQVLAYNGSALAWTVMPTGLLWSVTGNAGSTAGVNFLGTTDNQALELRVNNTPALRLVPDPNGPSIIGGAMNNSLAAGAYGTIIAGGSDNAIQSSSHHSTISGGEHNTIPSFVPWSSIAGGSNNTNGGGGAVIGGGVLNSINGGGLFATIPGGYLNTANGSHSAVAGGLSNVVTKLGGVIGGGTNNLNDAILGTIAGGGGNTIQLAANSATIAGGSQNTIQGSATYATIAGGLSNKVSSFSQYATIGGGLANQNIGGFGSIGGGNLNSIGSGSLYATIPGGWQNAANGSGSFAAGKQAKALHNDAFVWSDGNSGSDFSSTAANQFLVHAVGGVGINLNNPAEALEVNGNVKATMFIGNGAGLTAVSATVADGSITTPKLADLAVTTLKLADNAVINSKLANGAVSVLKLAAAAPTFGQVLSYNGFALAWTTPAGGGGGGDWSLTGNDFTDPNVNFLGTKDNLALTLRVNNLAALRLLPHFVTGGPYPAPSLIGGSAANQMLGSASDSPGSIIAGGGASNDPQFIAGTARHATISGGSGNTITNAWWATIGGGDRNQITAGGAAGRYNTIGGGVQNRIFLPSGGNRDGNTIAGGYQNSVESAGNLDIRFAFIGSGLNNTNASQGGVIGGGRLNLLQGAFDQFIGSGEGNTITNGGADASIVGGRQNRINGSSESFIGGGTGNVIEKPGADSSQSVIGGGFGNRIAAPYSFVGGGQNNTNGGAYGFIGGGQNNTNGGAFGFIGGGQNNIIGQNSSGAMIPGGDNNFAWGSSALAAGHYAKAPHNNAFVWADGSGFDFASTGPNQFLIRAAGGVGINTNDPHGLALNVNGTVVATRFVGDGSGLTGIGGGGGGVADGSITAPKFAASLPSSGQVLSYNGSALAWTTPSGGGGGWLISGNTIGGGNFLGSINNSAVELRANNLTALRITPGGAAGTSTANIIGGDANNSIAAGVFAAVISGGALNTNLSVNGVIAGGALNSIGDNASSSSVLGGLGNRISGGSGLSVIGGGQQNSIRDSAGHSFLGGGAGNGVVAASMATIPGGMGARARSFGQLAYASGALGSSGDAQASLYVLRGTTTPTILVTELFLDGSSARMIMPTNGVWTFDILVVANNGTGGGAAGYEIKGVIQNYRGNTYLRSHYTTALLESDFPAWSAVVEQDQAHQALIVKVVGSAVGGTVKWVASVRTVELVY